MSQCKKKGVYLFNKIKLYNVLKRSKSFTKMITILSVCEKKKVETAIVMNTIELLEGAQDCGN